MQCCALVSDSSDVLIEVLLLVFSMYFSPAAKGCGDCGSTFYVLFDEGKCDVFVCFDECGVFLVCFFCLGFVCFVKEVMLRFLSDLMH